MKVKGFWDWGFFARPYLRSCDELCNTVFTFRLPAVGGVEFFTEDRKFSDGLWYTSSMTSLRTDGTTTVSLSVTTYAHDDALVCADILMSPEEGERAFGDADDADSHPKIWTDFEVLDRATYFEVYDSEADDFVPLSAAFLPLVLGREIP